MEFYSPKSIYNTKHEEDDSFETQMYTVAGEHDIFIENMPARQKDDHKVYAKKIQKQDGSYKYMIRTAKDGKFFNPVSMYGEEKATTFLDSVCKSNDKFRTVSEKTFQWYLKFLSTKKENWLHHAEREAE